MKTDPSLPAVSTCDHAPAPVATVDGAWTARDVLGAVRVRLGIGRSNYRVAPGLYAQGRPTPRSDVFVAANYKLSFDHVRRALRGFDAWILVLDTDGVNVWCAAGKGTFSTDELCRRIENTHLAEYVNHRRLVLPQLGAVGVSAHDVTRTTGYHIEYGPVRAADIPAWLAARRKKDAAMRTVRFNLLDRLVLVPVEIHNQLRFAPVLLIAAFLFALLRAHGFTPALWPFFAGYSVELFGAGVLSASLVPMLLPWLPTRSFALKGAMIGVAWTAVLLGAFRSHAAALMGSAFQGAFTVAGVLLVATAISAFVALNFTGATVFTSQSGTTRETRIALPALTVAGAAGLVLQVVGSAMERHI